ncbi:hypothetical protein [Mesorhizobium sp. M0488]|uniref:hypothetical protein n=1 Tax=unclassified Mesorhizobium TaxID=325217 RepID=UPI003336D1D7
MASFLLKLIAIASRTPRHDGISKSLATLLLTTATATGPVVADQEDDYVTCLIDTAAKIMKSQAVKDPTKALDEAGKRCQPPSRIT